MSLLNWIWDLDQDSKLSSQEDKIEELEKRVEILEDWIRYLMENKRDKDELR